MLLTNSYVLDLRNKIYWIKIKHRLKSFLKNKKGEKFLLFGYPKSGNTWLRFLIFNYINIINNPSTKQTITFDELNKMQSNVMDKGTTNKIEKDLPIFYRTHKSFNSCHNLFDFKIYIHRNPLDTLVSSYFFYKNRTIPFKDDDSHIQKKLFDINFYVRYKFPFWKQHFEESVSHADFVINYTSLKNNTFKILSRLIKDMNLHYCEKIINKSISFSSYKNIVRMSDNYNQQYGNGPRDGTFKGKFLRSGEDGQFHNELDNDTINFVLENFGSFNQFYPI